MPYVLVSGVFFSGYVMSYPMKKAPDRAETSGDPLKSVIG